MSKEKKTETIVAKLDNPTDDCKKEMENLKKENAKLREDLNQAIREVNVLRTYEDLFRITTQTLGVVQQTLNLNDVSLQAVLNGQTKK